MNLVEFAQLVAGLAFYKLATHPGVLEFLAR